MFVSRPARLVLRLVMYLTLVVLYFPLLYVARLSVATSLGFRMAAERLHARTLVRRPARPGPSRRVHELADDRLLGDAGRRVVLGSLAAAALSRVRVLRTPRSEPRHRVLPIALPGIVTGIALNSGFSRLGVELSAATLAVARTPRSAS